MRYQVGMRQSHGKAESKYFIARAQIQVLKVCCMFDTMYILLLPPCEFVAQSRVPGAGPDCMVAGIT